jgi:DNA-binding transcriptional LysR family regulator
MSAAARELGYSQSAVTQQIQLLERQLQTALVVRLRNGIQLTEAGEVLVRHGASVLASMELALAEVEAVAGLRGGRVRIASFPSAAATILPRALGAMTKKYPDLAFTLTEAEPPRALEMLRRGECDIAIVYNYVGVGRDDKPLEQLHNGERGVRLLEENVHIAMPETHPAADKRWVEMSDLRSSRWIAGCPECRGNLLDACDTAGFIPDIAFETDDYLALQSLAAAGLGVALVPDLQLVAARIEPGLVLKRVSPLSMRVVSAVTTESLGRVSGVQQTLDALVVSAEGLELIPLS